jgi:hypothetical protein
MRLKTPIEVLLREHEEEFLLKRDRLLKLVPHYPSVGQHREELIRNFLREHLPQGYAVGTGFIYSEDRNCRQCDILIYDHVHYPVLFREGPLVVVDPSSVTAVIEVKSTLSTATLEEAFLNITNAKTLSSNAAGLVFSYSCCGAATLQKAIEAQLANGHGPFLPDGIYSLPSTVIRRYESNINCYSVGADESCFRHFYADLLARLPDYKETALNALKREKINKHKLAFTINY